MLQKLLGTGMGLLFFIMGFSQTSDSTKKAADSTNKTTSPVAITGSVDVYYRYDFNAPSGKTNNHTSFTNSQNSFELGMVSLRADHSFGKVAATLDFGFGRRAEEYSYNDSAHSTLFAVKQAYLSYQAWSKIKFTVGKWGTHIGYEVLDAYQNRNYSMDYMYTYGPFFHTGLKADIAFSEATALMVGIANPTDFSTTSSATKVGIAQFSTVTADGKWKFYFNYQGYTGVSQDTTISPGYTLFKSLNQVDLVVNGTMSSKFGIGINGTFQSVNSSTLAKTANWWGTAIYLNFDPNSVLGLTLRGEYFSDRDGVKINSVDPGQTRGLNVFDLTLTGLFKIANNLAIMPELRMDDGSKDFFYKTNDVTYTKTTVSALLAAVYHF